MEITLHISELKAALPGLAKVINRSASLPVLQHIHVSRSATGAVQIQATNISSFVAYQCRRPQAGAAGELLVPYEPLSKLVKTCGPSDQVTLSHDGSQLMLRYPLGGRSVEQPLIPLSLLEWPTVPVVDTPPEALDADLKAAISQAFACCSQDITRAALRGAWLDVSDPVAHYVMGTDGRHLYAANSFSLDLKEPLLLPHEKFLTWPGFQDDGDWQLAVLPAPVEGAPVWLRFDSEHWTFITQSPDHTLPNWRQVVPPSGTSRVTVRFNAASSAFLSEVLPKLPGKDVHDQPLRLEIACGKLSVTGRDRNCDHVTTLPVDDVVVSGPDLALTVNRTFIAKALKWGLTVLELTDDLSPLVFSKQGKRLVAMPLRNEAAPQAATQAAPTAAPTEITTEHQEEPMNQTSTEPTPEPPPVNRLAALQPTPTATKPTVRSVIEQIDTLRDALKGTTRQCGEIVEALRTLEKERRTNDREVEQVREKLRAIQHVTL